MLCLNRVDIGVGFNWKDASSVHASSPVTVCTASTSRASGILFALMIMSRKFNIPLIFVISLPLISLVKLTEVLSK